MVLALIFFIVFFTQREHNVFFNWVKTTVKNTTSSKSGHYDVAIKMGLKPNQVQLCILLGYVVMIMAETAIFVYMLRSELLAGVWYVWGMIISMAVFLLLPVVGLKYSDSR